MQPIETCTHAWNARSRCIGSVAGERSLVEPEPAAGDPLPARAEPVGEMGDRAGAERDVDLRVELEDPLALRLGVAATDRDHAAGVAPLARGRLAEIGASFVSGFSRIVQVLKTTTSASLGAHGLAETELLEHALDPLRVVSVHLAPEGGDEVAPGHRRRVPAACNGPGTARR